MTVLSSRRNIFSGVSIDLSLQLDILPSVAPHFQGEGVRCSAICYVVGANTARYWLRRLRNIERRNALTPCERMRIKILVGEVSLLYAHVVIASHVPRLSPSSTCACFVRVNYAYIVGFFGGSRPGGFNHVMRTATLRRMTFSYSR